MSSSVFVACSKDALHFLNLMMAAAPQQVTGTFLLPALQHYSHLLLPSQRSRSVKAGSVKTLQEVRSKHCRILQDSNKIACPPLMTSNARFTTAEASNIE